ncbi:hypothetical protein HUW46_01927 [Amycolatopsis sp. CA-230715]|nr:hypothetical protein HUW46_01927 [Amycolatopsis sp. CA-230715]
MKYDVAQIIGAVLVIIGGQGAIGQLIDHEKQALLVWVPGGWVPKVIIYVVVIVIGVLLAGWAHTKAKALGRRK